MPQAICIWCDFLCSLYFCTQNRNIPPEYPGIFEFRTLEPKNLQTWNLDYFTLRAIRTKLITYSNSAQNLGPISQKLGT